MSISISIDNVNGDVVASQDEDKNESLVKRLSAEVQKMETPTQLENTHPNEGVSNNQERFDKSDGKDNGKGKLSKAALDNKLKSKESSNSIAEKRRIADEVRHRMVLILHCTVIVIVAIGVICVVSAIIYTVMSSPTEEEAVEYAACNAVEKSINNHLPQSPIHANRCRKKGCTFNAVSCTISCPFGYTTEISTYCEISCVCASLFGIFDGDIHFEADDVPALFSEFIDDEDSFNVYSSEARPKELWPLGPQNRIELPFEIHESLIATARTALYEASDWLQNNTCVDLFPKRPRDMVTLRVSSTGPCRSKVGFKRKVAILDVVYKQELVLNEGCDDVASVLHLIFHALGFYHEQSRPDRDAFITLDQTALDVAVKQTYKINDVPGSTPRKNASLYPYNVGSIMHHTSDMNVREGDNMFVRKSTGQPHLTRRTYPDANDIAELHNLYECTGLISREMLEEYEASESDDEAGYGWGDAESWTEWTSWGDCYSWCGKSTQSRYKTLRPKGHENSGLTWKRKQEDRECNNPPCPDTGYSLWGPFGPCSLTCGGGSQTRNRDCFPRHPCDRSNWDAFIEKKPCNTEPCTSVGNVDAKRQVVSWQEWGGWGSCSRVKCLLKENAYRRRYCLDQLFRKSDECPEKEVPDGYNGDTEATSTQARQCECEEKDTFKLKSFGTTTEPQATTAHPRFSMFAPAEEVKHNYYSLCSFNSQSVKLPKWVSGEYNSRPGHDWVCHDSVVGHYKLGYSGDEGMVQQSDYAGLFPLCTTIYTGDFNGDGRDDLLCVDRENEEMAAHLNENDLFLGEPVPIDPFCIGNGDKIIVNDVNGDGKADVVCVEDNGHLTVKLNVKSDW